MKTPSQRFWSKVEKSNTCWSWVGARTNAGYGNFFRGPGLGNIVAHKWAYLSLVGNYDQSLDLDHLCRNRACVNPAHLEPVTRRVNSLRGGSPTVVAHREQACIRGHSVDSGRCLECQNASSTTRRHAKRAALMADPSLAPHGRLATYNNWMCRCEPCRDAYRTWKRRRTAARAGVAA